MTVCCLYPFCLFCILLVTGTRLRRSTEEGCWLECCHSKEEKNYFHLLEELCYNCSPSHIHMALSSGCHLQGLYLITNHGNVTKVTVTILWVIAKASLVSIYGSGPSFNVRLLDYFISFIICQAKIVRLIIRNSYMPFKT